MKILAFDFGASSGRAMAATLEGGKIKMEEIHRFSNDPVQVGDTFYWDVFRLYHEIKQGIMKAGKVDAIGIDTWGVDFGLLDENGIKIDHGSPLPWKDIKNAEYKTAKCCFQKLPVIILNPKKNIKYHYNFMQKRCAKMDFTAFSIPLYAMTPEDGEKIAALIGKKVKFINKKTALS